jgi:hypothetical protein
MEHEEEEHSYDYQVSLRIADVYALHDCVCERLRMWAGGEPMQQEHLYYLRDSLYRIILEDRFENL